MAIDRVTITGADDSILPQDLLPLTREFPFIEWGILVSDKARQACGYSRYPSPRWITDLQGIAETTGELTLSLHVCGRWVRQLLIGENIVPRELFHCFERVQLNFHAERTICYPKQFADCLNTIGKDYIFQIDGSQGNKHLDSAYEFEAKNCHPLFDISGGAGILPREWPKPIYLDVQPGEHGEGVEQHAYHGYAGGLGPENLSEEIPLILAAASGTEHTHEGRIWIDMETRVRSADDRQFDLSKVRRCLEVSAPFVKTEATA